MDGLHIQRQNVVGIYVCIFVYCASDGQNYLAVAAKKKYYNMNYFI